MSFVRTILGDIEPARLGVCYAHEHIVIDRSYTTQKSPDFLLDDVDRIAGELRDFHAAGGRAMVDSMPCDSGRNVLKLVEVSRRSGVHIVCPTGLHLRKYYPDGHWGERLPPEELAELFVADIEQGIDANDYGGPTLRRTPHKAGVIKIASGLDRIDNHERRIFEAAAIAHARTGAPILTHTEQGTAGMEQIELLRSHGVDLKHVVLSHTDRKPDLAYHRDLCTAGVALEYDSAFRWKPGQGNPTLDLVVSLLEHGLGDHVLLGMDAARRGYWTHFGGAPGLTYLLTTFWKMLQEKGITDADLRRIFVTNPARVYAFAERLTA